MAGTNWGDRRAIFLATALVTGSLVLAGCGSAQPATSGPPSTEAVLAAFAGSQSGGGTGTGSAEGATRKSSGGSVTLGVTWQNPKDAEGSLTFSVVMDTHSGDLDGYDLGELAVLRNDRGQEVKPLRWDAPPGGHHRSGALTFPSRDEAGKPLAGAGTKVLEMVIRDVAGVKERVLRWEVSG